MYFIQSIIKKLVLPATLLILAINMQAREKLVDRISENIAIINDDYYRVIGINTNEGIVLIDAHVSVEDMQECKAIFTREFGTSKFIKVIYSHGDLEHVLGHSALPEAEHICHEGMRLRQERNSKTLAYIDSVKHLRQSELAELDSSNERYAGIQEELGKIAWHENATKEALKLQPDVEFTDRMQLNFDSLSLELIYYGMGHGYSIFVYCPEEELLFCSTATPNLPLPFWFLKYNEDYNDVDRSLAILNEFTQRSDSLNVIVPCHGPYLTNKDLNDIRDYHQVLFDKVEEAHAAGKTITEVKNAFTLASLFSEYDFAINPKDDADKIQEENIEWVWQYLEKDHP